MAAHFNILSADEASVRLVQKALGVPRFIAVVLVNRGVTTAKQAREFLSPSLERDWGNPYRVAGMKEVVDGLELAVRDRKRVLVFGDFDVDGITATTVLTRGLRALGTEAVPFVPRRSDEGYGLSDAAIERLMKHEPDVVVTVDCGIASRDEVRTLQHRGVEVFVTDHHEPADHVPEDVPVCDPKLVPDAPDAILAGVGVALKAVQALGARFGQPHLWREFTDLAALGTVADLMPMLRGNRALVADGVKRMNEDPRPSVKALLEKAGAADKRVEASSLSFTVIPRLNAAGRMGDASLGLDLLLEDDEDAAREKAARLEAVNDQRRAIEAELSEIASLQAQKAYHGQRALVVAGEGWHEGVKGIVASHLVRSYGVPSILFTVEGDQARGSGRSVGQVNLFKAVESCSDLLTRFGGHAAAVGITMDAKNIPEFSRRLCAYMDTLPDECFHPRLDIDACVDLGDLTMDNVERLGMLAPFGQENPQPRFLARDVMLTRCRAVGAEKNHFSCTLTDGRHSVAGIMFHCGQIPELLGCDGVVDAAFEVQIDEWRGRRSVKAMLSSIAPVTPCPMLKACLDPSDQAFMSDMYSTSDADLCRDCCEDAADVREWEQGVEQRRAKWEAVAKDDPDGLAKAVVSAVIGEDGKLHPAQQEALSDLADGTSTLLVMATGRGKSLVFQTHAAVRALARHEASVFVYPLRALIADQGYHVSQALARFGVVAETLTGESTPAHRASVFDALASGACDIVLTTPEFLDVHTADFARSGRVGFLVVDEAHHIGQAKAGNRPAYARLGKAAAALGNPVVLALTATAGPDIAEAVKRELGVSNVVCDGTGRTNIEVDDRRNSPGRDACLANLVAGGQKTVVYTGSRQGSVDLARRLRKQVPQMAPLIGFYNAGLSRAERTRVERMFAAGELKVLVSTSAFGEGVDIPDVRNVVLYGMPFNEVEFNQMSGRVGRDGRPSRVHMLFGGADARADRRVLERATPDHDTMAQVYRTLRALQKKAGGAAVSLGDADISLACSNAQPAHPVAAESVACAVAVFRELGLVESVSVGSDEARRRLHVVDDAPKVELTDSVRYQEGVDELAAFQGFADWAMHATTKQLKERVCNPILPDEAR